MPGPSGIVGTIINNIGSGGNLLNNIGTGTLTDVLPQNNDTVYIVPDTTGIFERFVIKNSYEKDGKIYQMGIASPAGFGGQSVAFVQLAAPTLLWICNWLVERNGDVPIVPNPTTSLSGWVLLDDWWDTDPIAVAGADGSALFYRIAGTYVYGQTNPAPNTNAQVVYPITPWLNSSLVSVAFRTIPNNLLVNGLSDLLGSPLTGIPAQGGTIIPKVLTPTTANAGGASGQGLIH